MDDLISRQAAVNEFKTNRERFCDNTPDGFSRLSYGDKCRVDEIDNAIAVLVNLPSAQPGWIPCKTALPKDDTEVIVSCTDDSGDYEYSYVTTGWHYKGLWVVNNDRCYFVKAWQPLPAKPWEGRQDNGSD